MHTLKDIKVSKNRIPVQNAIWLRPIGGLKFKIYYPHGGDWAEMKFDGSSPSPIPDDIEKTLEILMAGMEQLLKSVNALRSYVSIISEDISLFRKGVNAEINKLTVSVERLYGSIEINTLILSDTFPLSSEAVEITDPSVYGIDKFYLDAIDNRTVTEVKFPEVGVCETTYETNGWSGGGRPHISVLILDTYKVMEDRVFTSRWICQTQERQGRSVKYYYAYSMLYNIDSSVFFLPDLKRDMLYDPVYKNLPADIFPTAEEREAMGLTDEVLKTIGNDNTGIVFVGKEAVPYQLTSTKEAENGWEYYTINMVCNDPVYNAQKEIVITAEYEDSEPIEIEVFYDEHELNTEEE